MENNIKIVIIEKLENKLYNMLLQSEQRIARNLERQLDSLLSDFTDIINEKLGIEEE